MSNTNVIPVQPAGLNSLLTHFQTLPDPRGNRTKDHPLMDLLVIAICTLLCGGETFRCVCPDANIYVTLPESNRLIFFPHENNIG
ncbi:MAG: transposase family protein [Verrucomicrobiota bacterium]